MGDRMPWFPLYVHHYESSQKVRAMTLEAEGAYNTLLRSQWVNRNVPASDEGLRGCIVKPCSQEALDQVKPCFPVDRSDASVRFNVRLEEIRAEQEAKHEAKAVSGRKGGIISGLRRRRVASSKNEATVQQTPSSDSVSSSSSKDASSHTEAEATTPVPGTALVRRKGRSVTEVRQHARDALATVEARTALRQDKEAMRRVCAELVFAYRVKRLGIKPEPRYNDKVERLIVKALRENDDDVSLLLYVVDGVLLDPWVDRRKQSAFAIILRDQEQIEKLAGFCPGFRAGKPHPTAIRYLSPTTTSEGGDG
jgi:hypothetical protein